MNLDPRTHDEWREVRERMHRVLDACLDSMQNIDDRYAWLTDRTPVIPIGTTASDDAVAFLAHDALHGDSGNRSPMFFGYAQGAGNVAAFMADVVASAANANCGGRVHHALLVEREVIRWSLELFGMPEGSGVLTCGTSEAHVLAERVMRARGDNRDVVVSSSAHSSVARAFADRGSLHMARCDTTTGSVDVDDVVEHVRRGASAVVVTLGTTLMGGVDDVLRIVLGCRDAGHAPWIHLDAAMGAHWLCSEKYRDRYAAWLPYVDSVAFDFHKGFQVQYDCGAFLCRYRDLHLNTFAHDAPYLRRDIGGISSDGHVWPADMGIALSRQNRALRAYATLASYGSASFGIIAEEQEQLGRALAMLLSQSESWTVESCSHGVVTFRLRRNPLSRAMWHAEIARRLQLSGEAVVTHVLLNNDLSALRACIMGHRTREEHVHRLAHLLDVELQKLEKEHGREEEVGTEH